MISSGRDWPSFFNEAKGQRICIFEEVRGENERAVVLNVSCVTKNVEVRVCLLYESKRSGFILL